MKFENAPGNGFEKYSLGSPDFSFGKDFVGPVTWECFLLYFYFKFLN